MKIFFQNIIQIFFRINIHLKIPKSDLILENYFENVYLFLNSFSNIE
jgi:hypothetical protein